MISHHQIKWNNLLCNCCVDPKKIKKKKLVINLKSLLFVCLKVIGQPISLFCRDNTTDKLSETFRNFFFPLTYTSLALTNYFIYLLARVNWNTLLCLQVFFFDLTNLLATFYGWPYVQTFNSGIR